MNLIGGGARIWERNQLRQNLSLTKSVNRRQNHFIIGSKDFATKHKQFSLRYQARFVV